MTPTATIATSVLLAAGLALGITLSLRPAGDAELAAAGQVAALQAELAELRAAHAELRRRLDAAPAAQPAATGGAVREAAAAVAPEQVAAAVEAYLQRRPAATAGGAAGAAEAPPFDLDRDFATLAKDNFWENSALWQRAFAAGRMDDVIRRFEQFAKANPNDPAAQLQLGNAYLAYLQLDQSKWPLSMKADQAFDRVLDLDPQHWEARFTKAMSYTFWPDFLGKKKEAVQHFELLVEQQEGRPAQPHEAQTYLFLGNLLEQRDPQRARELWARGARRHPENQELQRRAGG